MAGLAAADALLQAGHDPLILEARERVGGRILTYREGLPNGLYAELGAMRIPLSHDLTIAYVQRFGLAVRPFVMHNPRGYCYLYGHRHRLKEVQAHPELLDGPLTPQERRLWPGRLWEEALRPLRARLAAAGASAWQAIEAQYDRYSLRAFLEAQGWSEGAIELFGLLFDQEAEMDSSCLELLREELGAYYQDLVSIEGGMERLPQALLSALEGRVRLGTRVVALEQGADAVTVHYRTHQGKAQVSGARVILTVPFPVLRHIDVAPSFSPGKQRAIRQLHYDDAAKIYLRCRRRFWEQDDGIYGGGSVTDLPIRHIYYPQHGRETGQGMLLASYTWAQDADVWSALPEAERIERAVANVAHLHPQIREVCDGGFSKVWREDPLAAGAFALFYPRQQSLLHEHVLSPEGRVHFAGEHASLNHGWIQGAIESGLRAAREVHEAALGVG